MRHPSVRSRASLAVLTVAALSAFGAAYAQDKAKPPPPAWHQGKPPSMDASQARPARGQDDRDGARRSSGQQDQPAAGVLGPDLGDGSPRRTRDGAGRPGQDLRRHADHRPGVRDHRQRRPAVGPGRRRQARSAVRGRVRQRIAVRDGDQPGAALRRHREEPERPAGRPDRQVPTAARAASQLEVHPVRSRQEALCAVRRAVQHLRAAGRNTRRSGATTPTAPAWR